MARLSKVQLEFALARFEKWLEEQHAIRADNDLDAGLSRALCRDSIVNDGVRLVRDGDQYGGKSRDE